MAKNKITWTITDHICQKCSGRILQSASGVGATGGGNPLFRCADCGACTAAMGPSCLCWCGFQMRHATNPVYPYRCVRVDACGADPALKESLMACGFDPHHPKAEVGIIHEAHYRRAAERLMEG